eukprot:TRINITY_DN17339_c0_g2_i1.p2 TRINITY_DN17339_c0_g2~~TRINITY_DN17339_c0_g2_i1.p2  ORF type:complete len:136 (+),score=16.53 TRINITY_DN17339_c0_g2_i1:53-460(+)
MTRTSAIHINTLGIAYLLVLCTAAHSLPAAGRASLQLDAEGVATPVKEDIEAGNGSSSATRKVLPRVLRREHQGPSCNGTIIVNDTCANNASSTCTDKTVCATTCKDCILSSGDCVLGSSRCDTTTTTTGASTTT